MNYRHLILCFKKTKETQKENYVDKKMQGNFSYLVLLQGYLDATYITVALRNAVRREKGTWKHDFDTLNYISISLKTKCDVSNVVRKAMLISVRVEWQCEAPWWPTNCKAMRKCTRQKRPIENKPWFKQWSEMSCYYIWKKSWLLERKNVLKNKIK